MTLIFIDGFDTQDTSAKWATWAGPGTFSSTTRFGVGKSVVFLNDGYYAQYRFTAAAALYAGFAFRQVGATSTTNAPFFAVYGDTGATMHMNLRLSLTQLQLWRGGTLVATASLPILDSTWYYLEMSATIDPTAGNVTVRANNTTILTFTGNTKNGGTNNTIDMIRCGGCWAATGGSYFDDLYLANGLGTANNSLLGDCRVQTLQPSAAGSATALTPTGSATNYLNVNEVPDSTATYNGSATTGTRDTYNITDLAVSTGTVLGVQQVSAMYKSDAGPASMKAAQKSGVTVSYGATQVLSTSSTVYAELHETNPATSAAYTVADVNALEIGAEVA